MKISYHILFQVIFNHDFFKDQLIPDFAVIPSFETREKLQNYGLLLKKNSRGFLVLCEIDPTVEDPTPFRFLKDTFKLSFGIEFHTSRFVTLSDLPLEFSRPSVFYWNNLTNNKTEDRLYLTNDTRVSEEDLVTNRPTAFNLSGTSAANSIALTIMDDQQIEIESRTLKVEKEEGESEGTYFHQFDFADYESGRYTVKLDGSVEGEYYVDSGFYNANIQGVVELFHRADVPEDYRLFDDAGIITQKEFYIIFGARETFWKYYVILKNLTEDPGFLVSYTDPEEEGSPYPTGVTFGTDSPSQTLIDTYGEDKVLLFQADTLIPFYEIPAKGISLTKTSSGTIVEEESDESEEETETSETEDSDLSRVEVIKNLPNPSLSAIKPDSENDKVYSEIFIYV